MLATDREDGGGAAVTMEVADAKVLCIGGHVRHRGAFWSEGMDGPAGLTIQRASTTAEHLVCIRRNQIKRNATVLHMARAIEGGEE
jgi:hypothetical protein